MQLEINDKQQCESNSISSNTTSTSASMTSSSNQPITRTSTLFSSTSLPCASSNPSNSSLSNSSHLQTAWTFYIDVHKSHTHTPFVLCINQCWNIKVSIFSKKNNSKKNRKELSKKILFTLAIDYCQNKQSGMLFNDSLAEFFLFSFSPLILLPSPPRPYFFPLFHEFNHSSSSKSLKYKFILVDELFLFFKLSFTPCLSPPHPSFPPSPK